MEALMPDRARFLSRLALFVFTLLLLAPSAAHGQAAVYVTPNNQARQVPADTTGVVLDFVVEYSGTESGVGFSLSCTASLGSCASVTPETFSLNPGQSQQVAVVWDAESTAGVGTVDLFAIGGAQEILSDNGYYTVTVVGAIPAVSGVADPLNLTVPPPSASAYFNVTNVGRRAAIFTFQCGASAPLGQCTPPTSVSIPKDSTVVVEAAFPVYGAGSGAIWLQATADGATSVDTVGVTVVGVNAAVVVPHQSPDTFDISETTEYAVRFWVTDTTGVGTFQRLECDAGIELTFNGNCTTIPSGVIQLGPDSTRAVDVILHPAPAWTGSATATLVATDTATDAAGSGLATVVLVSPPPPGYVPQAPDFYQSPDTVLITLPSTAGQAAFEIYNPNPDSLVVSFDCDNGPVIKVCNPQVSGGKIGGQLDMPFLFDLVSDTVEGVDTLRAKVYYDTVTVPVISPLVFVKIIGQPGAPQVTPKGDTVWASAGTPTPLVFDVHNPGSGTAQYGLVCAVPPAVTGGCATPTSISVSPRTTKPDTVWVSFPGPGTFEVTLTATGAESDSGSYIVQVPAEPTLQVQPDGLSVQAAPGLAGVQTFTVTFTGVADTVQLSPPSCFGAITACTLSQDTLIMGTQTGLSTSRSVQVSYGAGTLDGDSVQITLPAATTVSSPSLSDSGWVVVHFVGQAAPPQVTPKGDTASAIVGVAKQVTFQVANSGTATGIYQLECDILPSTGCTAPAADTVYAGQSSTVTVSFEPASAGEYRVVLRASGVPPADSGWVIVTASEAVLAVTPKGGTSDRLVLADSMYADTFTVSLSGIDATVSLVAACSGIATNCSTPAAQALGPGSALGESVQVPITYTVSPQPGASTGRVTLRANTDGANALSDSGWVNLRLPLSLTVDDANPGLEELRGECLSIAAGAGAIECDDFRYVYPFLPVKRLNRDRNIGLLYNSEAASGGKIIGANLTLPLGATPEGVEATLWVAGQMVDSVMHREALPSGKPMRLALEAVDTVSAEVALIPYEVRVIAMYAGSPGVADTVTAAGHYLRVHRREEFGRGWWPTGYESLTPVSDSVLGNGLVWTGGDGSARLYLPIDSTRPDTFFAVTRGVPDFIVADSIRVGGSTGSPAPDTAYALNLNGSKGGTRAVGTHTGLTSANKLTWAFWIKPNGQSGRIGGVYASGDPNRVWWFEADNSGQELMVVLFNTAAGCCGGEPAFRVTSGAAFTQNAWNFVVVQFDGTQASDSERLKVWIDSIARPLSVPEGGSGYPIPDTISPAANAPFEWGRISAFSPGFTGQLGELAIVRAVLTAEQRSDWRTSGIDFGHPDLVAGYEWKGGLSDVSTAGNHLSSSTITGSDYVTTTGYPSRGTPSGGGGASSAPFEADGYVRKLLGGGEVLFDVTGRHVATVDRNGNETVFVHDTLGQAEVRLVSVDLPTKTGPEAVYQFQYDPTSLQLDAVKVLGGQGNWLTYDVATDSLQAGEFAVLSIATPDGLEHSFGYGTPIAGVIDTVTDHRGAKTLVSYAHGKVDTVRVVTTDPSQTATLAYDSYALVGADTLAGPRLPIVADSVAARVDGPRPSAVGDTTRFFVTAWGAVRGLRDPFGAETWLSRDHADYPRLVTSVLHPNGRLVSTVYGPEGLPWRITDGATGGTTTYEWDPKWRRVSTIVMPEQEVVLIEYDAATGNRLRETLGTDTLQHTTRYSYDIHGLLESVRPPAFPNDSIHRFQYDSRGNLAGETTPRGIQTMVYKDVAGLDTLVVSPIQGSEMQRKATRRDEIGRDTATVTTSDRDSAWVHVSTIYSDTTGDRLSVTPRASHPAGGAISSGASAWTYDQLGRVKTETTADQKSFTYDEAGNLVRIQGGDTLTLQRTEYDPLGRPTLVVTTGAFYQAASGEIDSFPAFSPAGVTIPEDRTAFVYDSVTGDVLAANNRYARISRTYEEDGLVATDTMRIRNLNDTSFATHVFGIRYAYDKNRRRTAIHHPGGMLAGGTGGTSASTIYSYDSVTGFLASITDPADNAYNFVYDSSDRLDYKGFAGGGIEDVTLDWDGRLTHRSINTDFLTGNPFSWDLTYDDRDKILGAAGGLSSLGVGFTGLGYLGHSTNVAWPSALDEEDFTYDGLGNVVERTVWPSEGGDESRYTSTYNATRAQLQYTVQDWTGQGTQAEGWMPDSTVYSYSGGQRVYTLGHRRTWDSTDLPWKARVLYREEARSFFGVDDRLMFHQVSRDSVWHTGQGAAVYDSTSHKGAFEEYWYDAFGRRVMKRSRQEAPLCTRTLPAGVCLSTVERFAYDGNQILYEVRRTDTADQLYASGGEQTGQVVYVHGDEIDAPHGVILNGRAIMLHRDVRGQYAFSTSDTGAHTSCVLESPCTVGDDVRWPAGSRHAFLNPGLIEQPGVWYGSLTRSQSDATGLLFRRNRYYDPQSGLFTQEDPIGIAGGLNLYGYANGDPINFSDPFGLCPPEDENDGPECEKGAIIVLSGEAAVSFFSSLRDGRPGIGGAFGEIGMAFNLSNGASMAFAQGGGAMGIGAEASVGASLILGGTLDDVVSGGLGFTGGKKGLFFNVGIPQTGNPGLSDVQAGVSFGQGAFFGVKKPAFGGGLVIAGKPGSEVQRCISAAVGLAPICR